MQDSTTLPSFIGPLKSLCKTRGPQCNLPIRAMKESYHVHPPKRSLEASHELPMRRMQAALLSVRGTGDGPILALRPKNQGRPQGLP